MNKVQFALIQVIFAFAFVLLFKKLSVPLRRNLIIIFYGRSMFLHIHYYVLNC
jgi:hypothetical protein